MPLQETLQVQLQQKRKKTNEEDSGNDMMRNWEPPHVLTQWVDDKKQRHLVILVVLPTGIAHEDTTNCLIEVDPSQLQVHVKVIWPDNATHIQYLTQHMHREWHVEEKNLRMKLALEDAMNQMRKRGNRLCQVKVFSDSSFHGPKQVQLRIYVRHNKRIQSVVDFPT